MKKTCRTCGVERDVEDFYMHDKARRKPDCKDCVKARERMRYAENPERRQQAIDNAARWARNNPERNREIRRRHKWHQDRKYKYGVTREKWAAMLIAQTGRCGICSEPMLKPCIDHDHVTGETRGLLCKDCNTGIGHLGDDVVRLAAAIAYLQGPPARML